MSNTLRYGRIEWESTACHDSGIMRRAIYAADCWTRLLAVICVVLALACGDSGSGDSGDEDDAGDEPPIIFNFDPARIYLSPGDSYYVELDAVSREGEEIDYDLAYVDPSPTAPPVRPNDAEVRLEEDIITRVAALHVETSASTEPGAYRIDVEASHFVESDVIVRSLHIVVLPTDLAPQAEEIVDVAGGLAHNLAVDVNGDVWAWGSNSHGQLGDGSLIDRPIPVRVVDLPRPAIAIAAGERHSIALLDDGTVAGWGDNEQRQVQPRSGRSPESDIRVRPELVMANDENPYSNITAIAAGDEHTLALHQDGDVRAWGSNARRALGAEGSATVQFAVDLVVVDVVDVAAGNDFSLALAVDGSVWGWGVARNGQIGADIGNDDRNRPVEIGFTPAVDAIGAGARHTLMVLDDGNVGSLGNNSSGQLGDGSRSSPIAQPFRPPFLLSVDATDGGLLHSIALQANRNVYAWGNNRFGQVSDSGNLTRDDRGRTDQLVPVRVAAVPPSAGVAAGGRHSLSIAEFCAHVHGWGDDSNGQLGVGSFYPLGGFRPEPRPVIGLGEVGLPTGCAVGLNVVMRGDGRVSVAGTAIQDRSCETEPCAASFVLDTVVDLSAVAEPGFEFVRWGGQCDSSLPAISITMDRGRNCLAQFNALPIPSIAPVGTIEAIFGTAETSFDVSDSRDRDGWIVLYEWDFDNDGSIDATGSDAEFVTTVLGDHTVRLAVTDDQGGVGETTTTFRVTDSPAPFILESPESVRVGETARFVAGERDTFVRYQWDFENDGTFDAEGVTVEHVYDTPGPRLFVLRVTSESGGETGILGEIEVLAAVPGQVTLTVVPRGGGNGTVINGSESLVCNFFAGTSDPDPCVRTVPVGTTETLQAFAAGGSVFSHWEVGECDSQPAGDPNPNCVIMLTSDREVDLYFE